MKEEKKWSTSQFFLDTQLSLVFLSFLFMYVWCMFNIKIHIRATDRHLDVTFFVGFLSPSCTLFHTFCLSRSRCASFSLASALLPLMNIWMRLIQRNAHKHTTFPLSTTYKLHGTSKLIFYRLDLVGSLDSSPPPLPNLCHCCFQIINKVNSHSLNGLGVLKWFHKETTF